MGKVYDALRRAEEQRARRIEKASSAPGASSLPGTAVPGAEPPRAPQAPAAAPAAVAPPPQAVRARGGLLRRVFSRSRGVADTAGAINKRRIALLQPESHVAEQFRSLRSRIDSIAASQPIRTVAVTSAIPGDGKSMSAISLAVVNSMHLGRRVLLVDCDLRRPAVHQALGLRVDAGLGEVLEGQAKLEEAIQKVEGSALEVLPVRGLPRNPSELLASERMRQVIEHLAGQYDRVILDLPPTLGVPDAKIVSELCDGVVFVVRADYTPRQDVESAIEVLDRRRILGLVMNDSETELARYDYRT